MTLMIILGAAAGVYLIFLMFRIAALALPVYSGLAAALLLQDRGHGYAAALVSGLAFGGLIWLAGQLLFAHVRSPLLRLGVAAAYTLPAGCAGYQLVRGAIGFSGAGDAVLSFLSLAGGGATAFAAWRSLAGRTPGASAPAAGTDPGV